jgi:phage regulator Rha-like protein
MNDIIKIDGVLAMDSREIAELTGKRHDHVMRDIEAQLGPLGGLPRFGDTYRNEQNGQEYPCYKLPYRETMILVSGYSVELRAKIIDRWMELEKASATRIPKTYAEALQLAADQAKALEIAAPKVESFDALMRSDQTMSITDAAKHFGLHPKTEVFPYLRDRGYLTLADLPTQAAIDAGYLALRETKCPDGTVRKQAVVLASHLDTWRLRVVPQIKAWEAK